MTSVPRQAGHRSMLGSIRSPHGVIPDQKDKFGLWEFPQHRKRRPVLLQYQNYHRASLTPAFSPDILIG